MIRFEIWFASKVHRTCRWIEHAAWGREKSRVTAGFEARKCSFLRQENALPEFIRVQSESISDTQGIGQGPCNKWLTQSWCGGKEVGGTPSPWWTSSCCGGSWWPEASSAGPARSERGRGQAGYHSTEGPCSCDLQRAGPALAPTQDPETGPRQHRRPGGAATWHGLGQAGGVLELEGRADTADLGTAGWGSPCLRTAVTKATSQRLWMLQP